MFILLGAWFYFERLKFGDLTPIRQLRQSFHSSKFPVLQHIMDGSRIFRGRSVSLKQEVQSTPPEATGSSAFVPGLGTGRLC